MLWLLLKSVLELGLLILYLLNIWTIFKQTVLLKRHIRLSWHNESVVWLVERTWM
jgi:hypothetical protein